MATLQEIKDSYNQATSSLSSLIRTINLGLIGVIWVLSNEKTENITDDCYLKTALLFIIFSLLFDILHYLFKSILIRKALTKAEKKDSNRRKKNGQQYDQSNYTDYKYIKGTKKITSFFWLFKAIFCFVSAIFLIIYFYS